MQKKIVKVFKLLRCLADDTAQSHSKDSKYAIAFLSKWCSARGFTRLVKFAVDCDYAVATYLFMALPSDKSSRDPAVSAGEVMQCLDIVDAMLLEGRAFILSEDNHSFTAEMLRNLSESVQIWFGGHTGIVGAPADHHVYKQCLDDCMLYARQLASTARTLFHHHYPDYEWRHKFSCFDVGPFKLPEAIRVQAFSDIAKNAGQDVPRAAAIFKSFMPTAERLWKRHEDSRFVWTELVESCRVRAEGPFQDDKMPFVETTLDYIGLLPESSDVERNFSVLTDQEYKKRERHLGLHALADVLRVAIEVPEGLDRLCTRIKRSSGVWDYQGKDLIYRAQELYAEFFGERSLECRKPADLQQTKSKSSVKQPTVNRSKPSGAKMSDKERRATWIQTAKGMSRDSKVG